jgi:flagellin-specific chaperone FliS
MLIAREKRKTNIAEYILYMWQVEDLIRAYRFNIDDIEENLISQYPQSNRVKNEVRDWYANLILMMYQEGIREKGHLSFLKTLLDEITDLHIRLLNHEGHEDYRQVYGKASSYLDEFRKKTNDEETGDIEINLNALYGLLLLRLKKQHVSHETEIAMASFSRLMAMLSQVFLQVERGEREL